MRATDLALSLAIWLLASQGVAADAVPAGPKVLIQTSMGDIQLQLDSVHAPVTVANFLRYAREGHFDGTVFYRVVPGFVIQAGSWDAQQQTRPVHDPIALEADNGLRNLRGAVAMARGNDPASATAEFFIDLTDNEALDHQANDTANSSGYAVFGQVVGGMDIVDKIAAVPLGDNGPFKGAAPVTPVTISRVTLLPDTP